MTCTGLLGNSCAQACVESKAPASASKQANRGRMVSPPQSGNNRICATVLMRLGLVEQPMRNAAMHHALEVEALRSARCRRLTTDRTRDGMGDDIARRHGAMA